MIAEASVATASLPSASPSPSPSSSPSSDLAAAGRIEIRGLHLTRAAPRGEARTVIADLDLTISPGELVCLLGPSGCGKSTLLLALAGFLAPAAGEIRVDGLAVRAPSPALGMVFQQSSLLPWRTVEDNVGFGLKMRGLGRRARRAAAGELLASVGLAGFERHYPAQLSGGMQQRVEIARVLINRPRVILMDEPFASLDAQTRGAMQELLLDVWSKVRTTVVFVTHDLEEAIFLGDRVLVMGGVPGPVREELAVPFPRPRSSDLTTSAPFAAIKRRCRDLVREETTRGLAGPRLL